MSKQEGVHVWIVDDAFHNLEASPIVSRIQGCPCEFCKEYLYELKKAAMTQAEDASTEVGTDSAMYSQKNRVVSQVEKILSLDSKANSLLQKLALVSDLAGQEYGLPVLLAYLEQIKLGNVPQAENPEPMGDEMLKID
jgi:hypothetical protein